MVTCSGRLGVNAVVAGNIGTPLSDLSPDGDAVVVAELSSQQAALLTTSPAVAVVTNLYEDHLDWHGDTDSYYLAKANVFGNGARSLVCTPEVLSLLERIGITSFPPSLRLVDPAEAPRLADTSVMSYEHNVINGALAVVAAEEMLGRPVNPHEADAAAATFEGLPHRLQTVRTTGPATRPTRWIDDTLATTGESVVAALVAMRPDEHIALIVGGMDRQLSYDQVDAYLCSGARRVTLIQSPSNGADDRPRLCWGTSVADARRRQPRRGGPGGRGAARRRRRAAVARRGQLRPVRELRGEGRCVLRLHRRPRVIRQLPVSPMTKPSRRGSAPPTQPG